MDEQPLHIPFLPFGELLRELREEHNFVLGVDNYERVQQLLNHYAKEGSPSVERLQYDLCCLLASSPEEQEIFDRTFTNWRNRYAFGLSQASGPVGGQREELGEKIQRQKLLFTVLAAVLVLGTLGVYFGIFYPKVESQIRWALMPGGHHIFLTDSSQVRSVFPDKVKQRTWKVGEKSLEGKPYLIYPMDSVSLPLQLQVMTQSGQRDSQEFNLPPRMPLLVAIGEVAGEKPSYAAQLSPLPSRIRNLPSSQRQTYQREAQNYRLLSRRFDWSLRSTSVIARIITESGRSLSSDSLFSLPDRMLRQPDSLRLDVTESWYLAGDTVQLRGRAYLSLAKAEETSSRLPFIPLKAQSLRGPPPEAVKALLKARDTDWRFALWAGLALLLYLLYELYRWRRQRLVLDQSRQLGPPVRADLSIEASGWPSYAEEGQEQALLNLRKRTRVGSDQLDLPATLRATIEAGGMPRFRMGSTRRPPHYLFLIEEQGPQDHFARLGEAWAQEMTRRDLTAEVFFYRGSPRMCWRKAQDPNSYRPLSQLAGTYGEYRLVIMGEARGLLNARSGQAEDLALLLNNWPRRLLLSPRPSQGWGQAEQSLSAVLPIVPARLGRFALHWQEKVGPQVAPDPEPEMPLFPEDLNPSPDAWQQLLDELRAYLGPQGYAWLSACAVYPELEWELSLNLGKALGIPYREPIARRLFCLPWFREGKIPEAVRPQLFASLSEDQRSAVFDYLIGLLSEKDNQAPPESLGEQEQRSQLAIYQYMRSGKDAEARKALKEALKDLPPEQLSDRVVVRALGEVKGNPLAVILPRGMFRRAVPFFGPRARVRGLGFAGLMLLFGLLWWSILGNPFPQQTPEPPYRATMLKEQLSDAEKATWFHYRAAVLTQDAEDESAGLVEEAEIQGKSWFYGLARAWLDRNKFNSGDSLVDEIMNYDLGDDNSLAQSQARYDSLLRDGRFRSRLAYAMTLMEQALQQDSLSPRLVQDNLASQVNWLRAVRLRVQAGDFESLDPALFDPLHIRIFARQVLSKDTIYLSSAGLDSYAPLLGASGEQNARWLLSLAYLQVDPGKWEASDLISSFNIAAQRQPGFDRALRVWSQLARDGYFSSDSDSSNLYRQALPASRDSLTALLGGFYGQNRLSWDRRIREVLDSLGATSLLPCEGTYRLRGRLLDAQSREPINRARVSWGAEKDLSSRKGEFSLQLDTCELGAGQYPLRIEAPGYASRSLSLRGLPEEILLKAEEDQLPEDRSYQGQVVDEAGQPLSGVRVRLQQQLPPRTQQGPAAAPDPLTTTDAQGRFRYRLQAEASRFSFRLEKEGYQRLDTSFTAEQALPGRFQLKREGLSPLSYRGQIVDESGQPLSGVEVTCLGRSTRTDGQGRFQLQITPAAGSVTFRARKAGYQPLDTTFATETVFPELLVLRKEIESACAYFQPTEQVLVRGGTFWMGSPEDEEGRENDETLHQVELSDFYLDKYEVTNAQFACFLNEMGNQEEGGVSWYYLERSRSRIEGSSPNRFIVEPGYEKHPVVYVSWYGARAYAQWLSKRTGRDYRLPTEAQWEYAAGGGQAGRDDKGYRKYIYSGSNSLDEVGWHSGNSGSQLHAVGGKQPNALGLYDMSGNVWEWCSDWYGDYPGTASKNYDGPKRGSRRVLRGGSWLDLPQSCRVAYRLDNSPGLRSLIGFRLSRTP